MDYQKFQQQLPELFNNWGEASCHPKADIFRTISTTVNCMISPNIMQLLNFAVFCLDENEIYCEVGTFQGASLISALINNSDKIAYAVDNYSELDPKGENFDKLSGNLERFNLADQVFFCSQDAEEFLMEFKNQELTEKIGVYFFDGSEDYRSYLLGLLALKPIISNQALIIITNCQWQSCQQAVRDFLATNFEARLIRDFSQTDYLLWNGIQIISWDIYRESDNNSPDTITVDLPFQKSITNITEAEKAQYVGFMESKALLLFFEKRYSEAERIYFNLLHLNKNNANVWQNLGSLYYEQGQYLKALDCLNQALMIDDSPAIYHYTSGLILEKININTAIQAYEKSIAINPGLVNSYINLGNTFLLQNEIDKAEEIFRKSINVNPLHFGAYFNLGNLLLEKRKEVDEAIYYYHKAADLNPNNIDILNQLGFAYNLKDDDMKSLFYQILCAFKQGEFEETIKLCKQGISIDAETQDFYLYLLRSLHSLGKNKEILEEVESALHILANKNNLLIQMESFQLLPSIYQNIEEIEFYREYFAQRLDLFAQSISLETEKDCKNLLLAISRSTNFYLSYQGKKNLDLQKQHGQILHKIMTANYPQYSQNLSLTALRPGEKIRVGYISSHLYNHNGANGCLGWVKNHNRQDFQLYCYHVGITSDKATEQYQLNSHSFVHIPNDIEAICQQVMADKLHIIVFPAIGMNSLDGHLAALRLAPIQCMAWGHPVTSGIPTVDYFLSSELMEPENAEEDYSETLIRLPNSSLCYDKTILPEFKKPRSEFGIPEDCILYLCCQSTFKYLPQYDYIPHSAPWGVT